VGILTTIKSSLFNWAFKDAMTENILGLYDMLGAGGASIRGARKDWLDIYGEHPWLHVAVSKISEAVAAVPIYLYRGTGKNKTEITEHPLLDLLNSPNPVLSGSDMRFISQVYMELVGEAFLLIERNRLGRPGEIWPIPPNWVRRVASIKEPSFDINMPDGARTVPTEDVLWLKNPDPKNPYGRGLGNAKPTRDDVESDEKAVKWNKRWFDNNATPGMVIETKTDIKMEQAKRMSELWMATFGGIANANKPAILNNGTLREVGTGHKDMAFPELRKTARTTILGAMGIHPSILGLTEDINRANAEAGEYTFSKYLVKSRISFWVEKLNTKLLPQFDKSLVLEFEDPVPKNRELDNKEMDSGIRLGAITINEWRASKGMPALKGGDILLTPSNATTTEANTSQKAIISNKSLSNDEWERRAKAFEKLTIPQEKDLIRLVKKLFQQQQDEITGKIKARAKDFSDLPGKPEEYLFNPDEWGKIFKEACAVAITGAVKKAGEAAMAEVDSGISFDISNPLVEKFIEQRLDTYLGKKVQETTLNALKAQLTEAYDQGEGIPQIMERVSKVYDDAKGYRAETIARTEIISSSNMGALQAYKQAGVEKKTWIAALDERTRPTHRKAHEEYGNNPIPVDKNFKVGRGSGPCPGAIGIPEEDVLCRCSIAPVIED